MGSWKNRRRECVPDFTSRVHVGQSIAVKSGVRELDRERMRLCESRVARTLLSGGVCDERVQKSSVHCNSDSKERVTQQFDGQKEIEESCMCGTTPDVRSILHAGANN